MSKLYQLGANFERINFNALNLEKLVEKKNGTYLTISAISIGGARRSRTALNGFAIRCITALLSRHDFDEKGKHGVLPLSNLERETRLELATSTLARLRSTN